MHRFLLILILATLSGCLSFKRVDSVPLNGTFVSDSKKTIAGISKNNVELYNSIESKPGRIHKLYTDTLIHIWENGKLIAIASNDLRSGPISFTRISSNSWQSISKDGVTHTLVILSPDSYYLMEVSPKFGPLREYFDRKRAEQGAAASP